MSKQVFVNMTVDRDDGKQQVITINAQWICAMSQVMRDLGHVATQVHVVGMDGVGWVKETPTEILRKIRAATE